MKDIIDHREAWLGLDERDLINLVNPLIQDITNRDEEDPYYRLIKLMRNPRYIAWTCKILFNVELLPEQTAILREFWKRPFPMYIASRGFGKSFLLALYAMLKCVLIPNTKIVIVGAAFRQSKVIFEYMDTIWKNAPILRSICSNNSGPRRDIDRCVMRINDSWAMAVPLGDGTKIRGLRAHTIIADEFNSIPPEIYETVVAGFTAVSADPVQNVKEAARRKSLQKSGAWSEDDELRYANRQTNQAILSGTAGYMFEHFADYWKRYHAMIQSRGEKRKLELMLGEENLPQYMEHLDWRDFSIIRIPYELIPEGFMDEKQVARARATIHAGIYQMEYGAVFSADSQGFFKRSLINSCVASNTNVESSHWVPWCKVSFDAKTRGTGGLKYVMGIDPASEEDNFALVIIELHQEHQRVVYSWTTNRKDFKQRQKLGLTDITDYYKYCARKIRELMKIFSIVRIGMDTQGGGHQIAECLHDPDKMEQGELPIWEVIDPDKEKETDAFGGLHILEMINFAKADWTSDANHGLRKDMEDKVLLFPRFDTITLSLAAESDKTQFKALKEKVGESESLKLYDTLEDCVMEIEALKDELCTIVMSQTGIVGRDRWDTPEVKLSSGKKGRLRKDRYSALVIANMLARQIHRAYPEPAYTNIGRVAKSAKRDEMHGQLYVGGPWEEKITDACCISVNRKK
jgi:hypothetical protein